MIKITKLDRRYNGYRWFKYIVEVDIIDRHERIEKFKEIRAWLWDTLGPGSELDMCAITAATGYKGIAEPWAWQTSHGERRLYIKTDADLTLLKLKWL
jgi:hypothetical protein